MADNKIIEDSIAYIEANIHNQLRLKDIADYAGYSEYHFSRMFKRYMGISIMRFVKRRRLIKAAGDILKGDKIIDVAMKYGYQSHSGFTKAFKSEFGFSPVFIRVKVFMRGGSVMNYIHRTQYSACA